MKKQNPVVYSLFLDSAFLSPIPKFCYHLYFSISAIQNKICITIHFHTAYFLHICGFYAKSPTKKETSSRKE